MHPRAIPWLLEIETALVEVLDALDQEDPDRAQLATAYALLVDLLDASVARATDVLARLRVVVERPRAHGPVL